MTALDEAIQLNQRTREEYERIRSRSVGSSRLIDTRFALTMPAPPRA